MKTQVQQPTTVHKELLKLIPVLTEATRRQDPARATARDCVHWKASVCKLISPNSTCPEDCILYQPSSVT